MKRTPPEWLNAFPVVNHLFLIPLLLSLILGLSPLPSDRATLSFAFIELETGDGTVIANREADE